MGNFYITGFQGCPDEDEAQAMQRVSARAAEIYALAGLDAPVLVFCQPGFEREHAGIGPHVTISRSLLGCMGTIETQLVAAMELQLRAGRRCLGWLPVPSDPSGMLGCVVADIMLVAVAWQSWTGGDMGTAEIFGTTAVLGSLAILARLVLDIRARRWGRERIRVAFTGHADLADLPRTRVW